MSSASAIEQLVGFQLVVGVPSTELSDEWRQHLRSIHARGFIPFTRNWETPAQFPTLLAAIRKAVGRDVLVMVDHEGGRWVRFSSGVTVFPHALQMGAGRGTEAVYQQGCTEAVELKALGIHLNLAPCVDVLAEGSDPVIGARSYGPDPALVSQLSSARIRGMQDHGLSACAKHFPGLGAVPKDPHHHLPTVELDRDTLRDVHLAPFVSAIHADVDTIMSSHVCYPALEHADLPATFSSTLIRGLLRQELGFQGVIVTDDLEMGALRELGGIGEAAVRSVEAGHDMVLVCSSREAQTEVFEALCAAYRSGRLSTEGLDRSVGRIAALRRKHGLSAS
jgi:beta-N-acetylhexosaminidase